jgi:BASS family bile acid:Na+ symporter
MSIEQLINLAVTFALIEMMAAIGLGVKFRDVGDVASNWKLLARAGLANYLCVPVITVALLLWFDAAPIVAAGFLIIAACPGAAFGPPFTSIAHGNVTVSVALMVLLAASSAIFAPLLLKLLLPFMAGSQVLKIDAFTLVVTLLVTQLLPLFAGLSIRQWRPALAHRLKPLADRFSAVLNLAAVALILAVHYSTLAAIQPRGFVGMFALVLATLGIGWLLGAPGSDNRKAMGLSTAVRNVAVGLVIATASFPNTPAVTAALAYGLFQTILLAVIALAWGRAGTRREPARGVAAV